MEKKFIESNKNSSFRKNLVVLTSMVTRNIKNQYRRSVLGIFWTVLNPLLNMLVMAFIFSNLFGGSGTDMDYAVYVLSGTIAFGLMRTATVTALPSLVHNYDLMTKTRIPYSVFPLANALSSLVNFAFSLIALIFVIIVRQVPFTWTMFMMIFPWLPSIMMFTIGISLMLSVIYVRFRDIEHLYGVVLTLWSYLTPVFYTLETLNLSDSAMKIMKLNPMLHYVNYFRDVINGVVPSMRDHLICYGAGLVMLLIGLIIFKLLRRKAIMYI